MSIMNSIKMMDSPFMKQRYRLKALLQGWKARKLNSVSKFANLKRQVKEIEEFYKVDAATGRPDHHVLKARENYADALINTINNNKQWYKLVSNDLTVEEKRERIRKMKEKNQRMKEVQVQPRNQKQINELSSPKGIHPDERPIKSADSYGFTQAIIANDHDEKPIKGGKPMQVSNKAEGSGGMMMTFDFSATEPQLMKKNFLKKKVGLSRQQMKKATKVTEESKKITEMEVKKEAMEETTTEQQKTDKSSQRKGNYLKKRTNLVYDPLKAVKEAKFKKQKEIEKEQEIIDELEQHDNLVRYQNDPVSNVFYEDDDLVNLTNNMRSQIDNSMRH
jgi:hypothetical protein